MADDSATETSSSSAAAAANDSDVTVTPRARKSSCLDALISSSASSVVAVAGLGDGVEQPTDVAAQNNNNNTPSSGAGSARVTSLGGVASLLSRRGGGAKFQTQCSTMDPSSGGVVTLRDVRKYVFQATARTDKRVMAGLRAHAFTSQTFISSFAVGLAIGSILAVIIKILTEVGYRISPFGH